MEGLQDLKKLLSDAEKMVEKNNNIVSKNMEALEKDENVPEEDKAFARMINSQVNDAIKKGDVSTLHSLVDQIKNKLS